MFIEVYSCSRLTDCGKFLTSEGSLFVFMSFIAVEHLSTKQLTVHSKKS